MNKEYWGKAYKRNYISYEDMPLRLAAEFKNVKESVFVEKANGNQRMVIIGSTGVATFLIGGV